MKYNKPELQILGDATHVIQSCAKQNIQSDGGSCSNLGPGNVTAYDLDE